MPEEKEYWVQIELAPRGEQTERIQLDLYKVKRTQYVSKNKKLVGAIFTYDREPGPSLLEGDAAISFQDKWETFMKDRFVSKDDEAEPSAIHVATNIKDARRN